MRTIANVAATGMPSPRCGGRRVRPKIGTWYGALDRGGDPQSSTTPSRCAQPQPGDDFQDNVNARGGTRGRALLTDQALTDGAAEG